MRIGYLTGEYPRPTDTFIQREVAALRKYGEAEDTTVHTFSVRYPKSADALSEQQAAERDRTSYLLPPNPLEALKSHFSLLAQSPKRYIKAISLAFKTRQLGIRGTIYQFIYFVEAGILARRIQAQGITHLHNHFGDSSGTVTMLAATLANIDYSFTLHGPAIFFEPLRWHLTEKIRRAKFVSCISYFCRSQAMIFAPWEAWPKLQIIHCGIEPELFEKKRSAAKDHQGGENLIYVGRLAAAKGLPVLLQSLSTLKLERPDIQLTVIGDGEDRAALEAQAQALNLESNVTFVGYQSPTEVREHLQSADVFVMSSFAEGVPVVLMEAMMAGLPVVATQIAGISELVEDGVNGFLVPPSNIEALTGQIASLLTDDDLRSRLGTQGQRKVEQDFNIHHEAKKLYALITTQNVAGALKENLLNEDSSAIFSQATAQESSNATEEKTLSASH